MVQRIADPPAPIQTPIGGRVVAVAGGHACAAAVPGRWITRPGPAASRTRCACWPARLSLSWWRPTPPAAMLTGLLRRHPHDHPELLFAVQALTASGPGERNPGSKAHQLDLGQQSGVALPPRIAEGLDVLNLQLRSNMPASTMPARAAAATPHMTATIQRTPRKARPA